MKYEERIKQTPEQKLVEEDKFFVEDAKAEIQGSIRETSRELSKQKKELNELKSRKPLPLKEVVTKQVQVEELEYGLQTLSNLLGELFEQVDS